jgi:hypothetical protein
MALLEQIIAGGCDNFPATPVWYAYTRGSKIKNPCPHTGGQGIFVIG